MELYPQPPDKHSLENLDLDESERKALIGLHLLIEGLSELNVFVTHAQAVEIHNATEGLSIKGEDLLREDDHRMGEIRKRGVENEHVAKTRLDRTLSVMSKCLPGLELIDLISGNTHSEDTLARMKLATWIQPYLKNFNREPLTK